MDTVVTNVFLPIALAIVMFGLGLSLSVADFVKVSRKPKAILITLFCQLVLLPAVCFGLIVFLHLSPLLAVGMMLLAATPGGTTANLFSHLFYGDVALNITVTVINSVIALITFPLIVRFAIDHFNPSIGGKDVVLPLIRVAEVFAIVLVPVAVGMLVRASAPYFAHRMDRPVRILSAVVLASVVLGAIVVERSNFFDYISRVGLISVVFCMISLAAGFYIPRALGVETGQAIASAMEIGVHNSTLAITIAISVLDSVTMAIPAAVYSIVMFPVAAIVGAMISRSHIAKVGGGSHKKASGNRKSHSH
ncbi:MAG: bile acid:sodium symporter family protein [Actinomycetota bacterium]|nr:bile acid:sodium symporter family protein [Actinomycetota bacterium]